jgi:SPW repeat
MCSDDRRVALPGELRISTIFPWELQLLGTAPDGSANSHRPLSGKATIIPYLLVELVTSPEANRQGTVDVMKSRTEFILDVYSLMLGAFLLVSPWLLASTKTIMGHDAWICGVLVVSLSTTALIAFVEWEEWCVLALGLWLAVSPWLLGFQNPTAMKVNVGIGLLLGYLAAMQLWLIHYATPQPPAEAQRTPSEA